MPHYLREFYRGKGIDLARWNGDDTWFLPVPANFIVGPDQTIIYASGDPDYTTRPDPLEIFEALP